MRIVTTGSDHRTGQTPGRARPVAPPRRDRGRCTFALVELFHHGYDLIGGDPAEYLSGFEGGWDTHHVDALAILAAA